MIVKDDICQALRCSLCGEITELKRRTVANPEMVMLLMEYLRVDHKDCDQYKRDPRMAAIQRGYKMRMRQELERADHPVGGREGRHG